MNDPSQFLEVSISGNADERGQQHGYQLATRIEDTIEFYACLFAMREQEVTSLAKHFKALISQFDQSYITEIEAIASAAKVDSSWVYALNARTEILIHSVLRSGRRPASSKLKTLECTAIYFEKTGVLGQNWDWSSKLEGLAVLMNVHTDKGPSIKMLTEPGILGKIGMNTEGLGVMLNILPWGRLTNGLPIHILLRAILDSTSITQARERILEAGAGKSSNIILARPEEGGVNIEFTGDNVYEIPKQGDLLVHTNHHLSKETRFKGPMHETSLARYSRAKELIDTVPERDIEAMQTILSDQTQCDKSICAHYHPHDVIGDVGTVFSVAMNLKEKLLYLRKGSNVSHPFICYSF